MAKKILVIEDDPSATRLIGYTLEQEGYHVLTAPNGLEGLKKAQEEELDLLILDVMLPGLDGFQICRRLRAESRTNHLPILMLSAKAQEVDKATGLKVGADEYLTKPHDPSELVSRVENLLAQKSTENARTIAFLGSKGGVGTSTVAVNAAVAISMQSKRVILVDLCPYCGTMPAFLGLKPEHTIVDLFDRSADTIDRHELEAILTTHSTGIRVLPSPQTAEDYQEFSPSGADSLFEALRSMADYILADVSAHPSEAVKAVLRNCDSVVMVTGSGPDGLTRASSTAALLKKMGIDQERLGTVVVDREELFSDVEFSKMKPVVESTIHIPLLGIIPHDAKAPVEFEARGMPVTLAEPKRPLALALRQLAEQLTTGEPKAPEDRT